MLTVYVLTTGLYLLAECLREVVNSRKLDLYFLGSLFYTFVLTVVMFALEYLGLERIAPGSFAGVPDPGLLDFLGLSVSTIMTADVSPLHGVSGLAQTALYLQLLGSLLIIVLLVFVILTSIRERYKQDLDGMVHELAIASGKARERLEANYELTIAAAEAWLLEFNPPATRWFLKQLYGEARVREIEAQSAEQKDGADAQERRGSSCACVPCMRSCLGVQVSRPGVRGADGPGKRQGVTVRWGLQDAWNAGAGRGTRTGYEVWYSRGERARHRKALHPQLGGA